MKNKTLNQMLEHAASTSLAIAAAYEATAALQKKASECGMPELALVARRLNYAVMDLFADPLIDLDDCLMAAIKRGPDKEVQIFLRHLRHLVLEGMTPEEAYRAEAEQLTCRNHPIPLSRRAAEYVRSNVDMQREIREESEDR